MRNFGIEVATGSYTAEFAVLFYMKSQWIWLHLKVYILYWPYEHLKIWLFLL